MVDASGAGTIVAVVAGPIGWFMVLRRQTFAGHTLAVVGFPGAAGAALIGVSASYGYFAFCIVAALVIAAVPRSRPGASSEESAVIGTTQAFALACGFLFVTLYAGNLNGVDSLLFGNFLGITVTQVVVLAGVAAVALVVLGRHRPAPAVRHRRPRGGPEPGRAGAGPVGGVPGAAGGGRGRDQPDHRLAAGVRPAGPAGGHRPGATARPAGAWPGRGPGPGRHLGRPGRRPTSRRTRSGSGSPRVAFGVYLLAQAWAYGSWASARVERPDCDPVGPWAGRRPRRRWRIEG